MERYYAKGRTILLASFAMRGLGLYTFILASSCVSSIAADRSLQATNLLGDDFFIDFGGFALDTENAETKNCTALYEVLATCLSMECSDFVDVCPHNNGGDTLPEGPLTCNRIDRTICRLFDTDGCCMNACAFELQDLVLCVSESGLSCDVPRCNDFEIQVFDTDNATRMEDCVLEGSGRYSCVHLSNISLPEEGGVKMVESTINCTFDRDIGFNVLASEDCVCEAAVLTKVDTEMAQVCGCDLCRRSDSELVSLDCNMSINDPFVFGDCSGRGCNGDCINEDNNTSVGGPTARPTTQPQQPEATTTPTASPTVTTQTNAPTLIPSLGTPVGVSAEPTLATVSPTIPTDSPSTVPTSPPTSGATAVPTTFTTSSLVPSGNLPQTSQNPQFFQPTIVPSNTVAAASAAPSSVPSGNPTTIPTTIPTNWLASGNVTEKPDKQAGDDTQYNTAQAPTESSSVSSSDEKMHQHQAFVTIVGAFLATCLLLCVLVTTKKVPHNNEGGDKVDEAAKLIQ